MIKMNYLSRVFENLGFAVISRSSARLTSGTCPHTVMLLVLVFKKK